MKILHTADLHLGKRLGKASRLDEQCDVIRELAETATERDVDVILIAGDVFDASVPPSEAERVFYRGMITLAEHGRAVIALAGNHDDEKRLCAATPLAGAQGIVLVGEPDQSGFCGDTFSEPTPPASLLEVAAAADYLEKQRVRIIGRNGGVTIEKGGERVNIALVPYPSESRLSRWAEQDYSVPYVDRVKAAIDGACGIFRDGEYNMLCTHLFLTKNENETLGGLAAMPISVLPETADYIALGHVHKRYTVCKKPLAAYCGSPLQYAYDETRDKSVTLVDTAARTVSPIPLSSGKKLYEVRVDSYDDCMKNLDFLPNAYIRLLYGGEPLGKDETLKIKAHPAFNDLAVVKTAGAELKAERRAHLSDGEIFDMYYKHCKGKLPSAELKAAFVGLMEELKSESK